MIERIRRAWGWLRDRITLSATIEIGVEVDVVIIPFLWMLYFGGNNHHRGLTVGPVGLTIRW